VIDIFELLKLADVRAMIAPYGELPDLGEVDFDRDVVFAWNGTTSGVRVPVAIGSLVIAKVSPSAMRPPRCSRKTSTGPSSMSRPSPGRRCWAAKRSTACLSFRRALWIGSIASCRLGRCRSCSASRATAG
jgi:hypothetical protein